MEAQQGRRGFARRANKINVVATLGGHVVAKKWFVLETERHDVEMQSEAIHF